MTEIAGCVFIIVFGALGHFIYEWSGHRKWAAVFFAVNESTWEHIKLSIYPSFVWLAVEIALRGWSESLIVAQFAAMVTMILLIPGLFYGYTAITRKNWLLSDILVFCAAIAAGMWVFSLVTEASPKSGSLLWLSVAGLLVIAGMYLRFSLHPPHNFLFKDPLSGQYGAIGHGCHSDFHTHNSHHHHNRQCR